MARIKIKDLPNDQKINKEEMKMVVGGARSYSFNPQIQQSAILRGSPFNICDSSNLICLPKR